jgi:L-alanine-DL-glutamate epimerase-like enolase superfamily enzyme
MILSYSEYDLQLRNTFKTAHSQRDVQHSIIVALSQDGITGYGEVPVNTYYEITREMILADLDRASLALQEYQISTPEALHEYAKSVIGMHSFPLCALDEAAYDWFGKRHDQATHVYLGSLESVMPKTNFTIGIDTVDKMVDKMKSFPWPIYKVKLGTPDDLTIVGELRKHTNAIIRVDANCGWSADETVKNSGPLSDLGVEFIEQPLPPEDTVGMARVFQESKLPIIADESCLVEEDVAKCLNMFHGINIKLTKCGGITPARRMIEHARSLGMQVMAGCMTESSVGISAVCQLAPFLDYIDADGALLITNDPATGVTFDWGDIIYAEAPGNGVVLLV